MVNVNEFIRAMQTDSRVNNAVFDHEYLTHPYLSTLPLDDAHQEYIHMTSTPAGLRQSANKFLLAKTEEQVQELLNPGATPSRTPNSLDDAVKADILAGAATAVGLGLIVGGISTGVGIIIGGPGASRLAYRTYKYFRP